MMIDDTPTVKRHCTNKPGTRGEDEVRLEAHIEESLRQVTPQGIDGALSEIERSSRAVGINIGRESFRNILYNVERQHLLVDNAKMLMLTLIACTTFILPVLMSICLDKSMSELITLWTLTTL